MIRAIANEALISKKKEPMKKSLCSLFISSYSDLIPMIYNQNFCSGVRDYIHVVDLALGHVAALKKMMKEDCGFKVQAVQYAL